MPSHVYPAAGLSKIGSEVLNNMKKPFHTRVGDFLEGKGFYIVLLLCVAAIGVSGWYLFTSLGPDDTAEANAPARITVTPKPAVKTTPSPRPTATPAPTPKPTAKPVKTTPAPSAAPSPTPAASQTGPNVFVWPVQGDVLSGFSVEVLAYDQTMGDWRAHAGLDLSAVPGTEVRAAASGTVTDVYEDALMGTTVAIDHGDGLTSTYANLAAVPTVEIGDTVLAGDLIGSVGQTAIAESALPGHLHFVLCQDGEPVDPLQYLPD